MSSVVLSLPTSSSKGQKSFVIHCMFKITLAWLVQQPESSPWARKCCSRSRCTPVLQRQGPQIEQTQQPLFAHCCLHSPQLGTAVQTMLHARCCSLCADSERWCWIHCSLQTTSHLYLHLLTAASCALCSRPCLSQRPKATPLDAATACTSISMRPCLLHNGLFDHFPEVIARPAGVSSSRRTCRTGRRLANETQPRPAAKVESPRVGFRTAVCKGQVGATCTSCIHRAWTSLRDYHQFGISQLCQIDSRRRGQRTRPSLEW